MQANSLRILNFWFYIPLIFLYSTVNSSAQNTRLWSTYYGGSSPEQPSGITTDINGNIYIVGSTSSGSGIAFGGFQNNFVGGDVCFLAKFSSAGQMLWATYYGGSSLDAATSVATDASGNVYLAGQTNGGVNLASGGFQNFRGGGFDAFLVKFDSTGNRIWATYYGGPGDDFGTGVATDKYGNVFLTGHTASTTRIASLGFQNSYCGGMYDNFLAKFNSSGNRLWATYYGGAGEEESSQVTCDLWGNIYLEGNTNSISGIASSGFQNIFGGGYRDSYLVKFNSSGARLWATYYGGSNYDYCNGLTTDHKGNIYLTGETSSISGIASGGFQDTLYGNYNAFLAKFDSLGKRIWGTYYGKGPNCYTEAYGIASDSSDCIYISGESFTGSLGMSSDGFQSGQMGFMNAFLAKFDTKGNRLCSTLFGMGSEQEEFVATDAVGNVYLTGDTQSSSGIASNGFQDIYSGGSDAFLVKFTSCCAPNTIGSILGPDAVFSGHSAILTAPAGYTNYSWVPGGQITQTITINPTVATTYTVAMSGTDNCTAIAVLNVNILDGTVLIPNIFTPNGDGNNDVFKFQTESIKDFHCSIFDRWGVKLAEINCLNGSWDGRDPTGVACVTGIYYYVLSATDINSKVVQANGFIQLMR